MVPNHFCHTGAGIFIKGRDACVSSFLMVVCHFCVRDESQTYTPPRMSIGNANNNKLDYAEQVWSFLLLIYFPESEI